MQNPVSLQIAIINKVTDFAKSGTKFSVHDITRTLRDDVRNGNVSIPEIMLNGSSRFDLPHTKVRQIFRDERNNGRFDPICSLQEDLINNEYFQYTPTLNTPVPQVATVGNSPISKVTNCWGGTGPMPNNKPKCVVAVDTDSVKDRVNGYLNRCCARYLQPTIEQIRCAIKRGNQSTGWTCEDLATLVQADLGYTLVTDPDYVSKSRVVV